MENIYYEGWEQELVYQFLPDRCRKRAYVCSPLSADTDEGIVRNMQAARAYMFYAMKKMGMNASAPHAYLPMILCYNIPSDRALALRFGLELLKGSDVLLVCGNRISSGMRGEIAHAARLKMPVVVFDEGIYLETLKELTKRGCDKQNVCLDREHFLMGLVWPLSYAERS